MNLGPVVSFSVSQDTRPAGRYTKKVNKIESELRAISSRQPLVREQMNKEQQKTVGARGVEKAIHTYHTLFIFIGVTETSQIFLHNTHILPK
jgi:hypothetical protein